MESDYDALVRLKREQQERRSAYSASLTDAEREEGGRRIMKAGRWFHSRSKLGGGT